MRSKSSGTHDGRIQAEGSVEEPDELRPIAIGCHEHRDEVVIWAHVQGFRVRDIADPTIHEPSIGHGGIRDRPQIVGVMHTNPLVWNIPMDEDRAVTHILDER